MVTELVNQSKKSPEDQSGRPEMSDPKRTQVMSMERPNETFVEKLRCVDITPLVVSKITTVVDIDRYLNRVRAVAPKRNGAIQTSIDDVIWTWKGKIDAVALEDAQMGVPENWEAFEKYAQEEFFESIIEFNDPSKFGRLLTYAKTVLKPIISLEAIAEIERSEADEAAKTALLKTEIKKIWVTDSKVVSPAGRLRTTLEGIRVCLADYIQDEWLRKTVLTGGQIGSIPQFREFLINLRSLDESTEDYNRLADLAENFRKVVDGPDNYMTRYLRLLQLGEEYRITPVGDDSVYKYGAYENETRPKVGAVKAETPKSEDAVGAKPNKTELISPAMRTMFMGMALSHLPRKTIREIEHKFIQDNGSLHPLALAQHRYHFHELAQLEEKVSGRKETSQNVAARRVAAPSQMSASELAEGVEKLHICAMQRWGDKKKFDHAKAPRYTEHFKRAQEDRAQGERPRTDRTADNMSPEERQKHLPFLRSRDFCTYCAHYRPGRLHTVKECRNRHSDGKVKKVSAAAVTAGRNSRRGSLDRATHFDS